LVDKLIPIDKAMDSITQATLGAAIGQAVLGKKIGNKAAILGAIIATIPDLDVIFLPFYDSIDRISIHRGYSHSIVFSIVGASLLAFLLSRMRWTKQCTFPRLLLFTWLALFTHMLLDAFTAYGTQLFLPFSDYRVSFDSMNIVDPVYTLPLFIGLSISLYQQNNNKIVSGANGIGLLVSSIYLLYSLGHKQHITKSIKAELQEQNIGFQTLRAIPVGIGNMNWYGVARNNDTLYVGEFSDLNHTHIQFHAFPINEDLLDSVNPDLSDNLKWFAQDHFTVSKENGKLRFYNLQCDMQGVRNYGTYRAPTASYFEIIRQSNGSDEIDIGMHTGN